VVPKHGQQMVQTGKSGYRGGAAKLHLQDCKKSVQFLVIFLKALRQAWLKSAFIVFVMFYKCYRTTKF